MKYLVMDIRTVVRSRNRHEYKHDSARNKKYTQSTLKSVYLAKKPKSNTISPPYAPNQVDRFPHRNLLLALTSAVPPELTLCSFCRAACALSCFLAFRPPQQAQQHDAT